MHWKHSRFDVAYLILGNCHTYDEGYRVLCELEEDRQMAIDTSLAESFRAQAKVVGAKETLADEEEFKVNKLRAQSFIDETNARTKIAQPCLDEARREIDFLQRLKDILRPLRQFNDYPDEAAFQLCQPLEWKYDIFWKMYSQMCANRGTIDSETFMLIKMHPSSRHLLAGLDELYTLAEENFTLFIKTDKREVLKKVSTEEEIRFIMSTEKVCKDAITADIQIPQLENKNAV